MWYDKLGFQVAHPGSILATPQLQHLHVEGGGILRFLWGKLACLEISLLGH